MGRWQILPRSSSKGTPPTSLPRGSSHSFCSRPPPPEARPCGSLPLTEQPRTGLPPSAASVHLHPVRSLSLSLSAATGRATAAAAAAAQRQVPRPSSVSSLVTSTHQAASSRKIAARAWFALTTYTVISASDPARLRLYLHLKEVNRLKVFIYFLDGLRKGLEALRG